MREGYSYSAAKGGASQILVGCTATPFKALASLLNKEVSKSGILIHICGWIVAERGGDGEFPSHDS